MGLPVSISESDNTFGVLFYKNPQPAWIIETDTLNFIAVNDAAVKQYGYTRNEFLSSSFMLVNSPHEYEYIKELSTIQPSQVIRQELTHIKKNGALMFVEITSYSVQFCHCSCMMITVNDITEKKLKDIKLKEAWQSVRKTLESITDGFITLSTDLKVTYWNKEAEHILEVKRQHALNREITEVCPYLKGTEFYDRITSAFMLSETIRFEEFIVGINKWVSLSIFPNESGMTIYFKDTSAKRTNTEIINAHNKKLQDLAFINSHLIRKPLANILGIVYSLEGDFEDDCQLGEYLSRLKLSANELDAVIMKINMQLEH